MRLPGLSGCGYPYLKPATAPADSYPDDSRDRGARRAGAVLSGATAHAATYEVGATASLRFRIGRA
jgi:hypothetical protein